VPLRADSDSRRAPRHSEMAPIGRLMKKAHGQPMVWATNEPSVGPTAAAKPATAPHRLTMSARCCCGNAASTIDSDAGVSSAAPIACSTRAAISHATLPANPQATDAAMNNVAPSRNTRLRPYASARPPAGISIAAYTTVYALSTHDMSAALASGKPARSAPNAAYNIVASSDTRNDATLATQNTGHGEVWARWVAAVASGVAARVMVCGFPWRVWRMRRQARCGR
jgi:hypothetical protein